MGLMLAEPGFHTRCWVEWEEYPREVLVAGMRAGYLAPAPIWDNVKTFDARPYAGAFDTLVAGYPCQPFSMAGQRKGEDDPRHLWPDIERIIGELGDELRWCFFENVSGHLTLGLDTVLHALHRLGFRTAVGLFSAEEVGATHERQRIFIVAHREGDGSGPRSVPIGDGAAHTGSAGDGGELADTDDWGARPERQQCRGEQRFQPESRGSGDSALVNDPGIGCGEGRTEPELRSGRDAPAGTSGELADTSKSRPQGREQRCAPGERHRTPSSGSVAERCGIPLAPPGPSDDAAWAAILGMAPDLAPSVAFGDIARRAGELAALVEAGKLAEAEAEPALCRMVDGLASRSRALRLLGNGVYPLAAGYAWRTLSAAHGLGWVDLEGAG